MNGLYLCFFQIFPRYRGHSWFLAIMSRLPRGSDTGTGLRLRLPQQGLAILPLSMARVCLSTWQDYEDRWDLLSTSTSEVPVLLPRSYRELAREERIGLPVGHPWNDGLPHW